MIPIIVFLIINLLQLVENFVVQDCQSRFASVGFGKKIRHVSSGGEERLEEDYKRSDTLDVVLVVAIEESERQR